METLLTFHQAAKGLLPLAALFFALFPTIADEQTVSAQSKVRFEKGNGTVIVPVFLNGQGPFRFILDTGTTTCLIDESLARDLVLQAIGKTSMMSPGGVNEAQLYLLTNVKLGDAEALNVQAVTLADSAEVLTSRKARGLLGLSFLNRYNFLLDYKDQSITFELDSLELPSGEAVYRLDGSQALPVVLLPMGNDFARLILDSGAKRLVLFETKCFPHVRVTSTSVVRTASGEREVSQAEISGLKIGKRTLNKEKVLVLPQQGPEDCDGLLPARMFSRLYFDNRNHRLVINPTVVREDASTK